MRSLATIASLDRAEIERVLARAGEIENDPGRHAEALKGKMLALTFFEPSTRTRVGFSIAMQRMGGGTVEIARTKSTEAMSAPESLSDTLRVIGAYVDILAMRHALEETPVPGGCAFVNCGNGQDEHPSQTLVDLYAIQKRLGRIDNLAITLVGDLSRMRAAHSLLLALAKFDVRVKLISPPNLSMPTKYLEKVEGQITVTSSVSCSFGEEDVLYMAGFPPSPLQTDRMLYALDKKAAERLKEGAIVLSPLPRVDEIAQEVDSLPCAAYFEQSARGLFVRMALLQWVLE